MRIALSIVLLWSVVGLAGCGYRGFAPTASAGSGPAQTSTVLSASPNPAFAGSPVSLTATVTSSSGTPPGVVTFFDGVTSLGVGTLTGGSATFTLSTLTAGSHSLSAVYSGATGFNASVSPALQLTVQPAFTATASFSFNAPNQTIAGFGGAEAFYLNYLDTHPNEAEIMKALFDPSEGLGITFLRVQNSFYLYTGSNASTFDLDTPKILTAANAAAGSPLTVLMTSWTPPASLKSNGSIDGCTITTNGLCSGGYGTLAIVNGAFDYAGFAQFWLQSLQAYATLGVVPAYISVQNEPDEAATYVGCVFNPTEAPANYGAGYQGLAGYGLAVDAVYKAIHAGSLSSVPNIIGPENYSVANAASFIAPVPSGELSAIAHHLYNVSSYGADPSDNEVAMTNFDASFPTQLKFETEYFQTPGFSNAVDIHNALTLAGDSVYLYWQLTWPSTLVNGISSDQQGLLYIDNPFTPQSSWAFPSGWTYNDAYYALKHFSRYIRPGYIRYNATLDNPADEKVSVYQSPDTNTTVIVLLNVSTTNTDTVGLNLAPVAYSTSTVFRSSFQTPITASGAERWNNLGAYAPASGIVMPPQSAVTVVLSR